MITAGWKRPLLLVGACWIVFAVVLVVAYWVGPVRWADGWAVAGLLNLQRPWLNDLAHPIAKLADPAPFAVWTALLAGVAFYRKRPRLAIAVVVLLLGASLLTQTLKVLLEYKRYHPFLDNAQVGPNSFPSGHATASMALAFAAVLVAPPAWRRAVALGGALFALAVSESIMLLGWHFPSDVAGGFLVATACALSTVAALQFADERWPERSGREVALRVIGALDLRRVGTVVAGFVVAALAGVAVAAGASTLRFADHHTTAVAAVIAVAAMAAALPVSVVAIGARRSER